jgi:uncharacterized protein (DUF2267 family)
MSANGLEIFDKTLQVTNIWLCEIMEQLGPDRHMAWKVLSTVLHELRDRLPAPLAAHLGAQLPLLVRGAYYDQYEPGRQQSDCRTAEEFTAEVAKWLSDFRPVDPDEAVRAVFGVLTRHVSGGQIAKVQNALPASIRDYWQALAQAPRGPEIVESLRERIGTDA